MGMVLLKIQIPRSLKFPTLGLAESGGDILEVLPYKKPYPNYRTNTIPPSCAGCRTRSPSGVVPSPNTLPKKMPFYFILPMRFDNLYVGARPRSLRGLYRVEIPSAHTTLQARSSTVTTSSIVPSESWAGWCVRALPAGAVPAGAEPSPSGQSPFTLGRYPGWLVGWAGWKAMPGAGLAGAGYVQEREAVFARRGKSGWEPGGGELCTQGPCPASPFQASWKNPSGRPSIPSKQPAGLARGWSGRILSIS